MFSFTCGVCRPRTGQAASLVDAVRDSAFSLLLCRCHSLLGGSCFAGHQRDAERPFSQR
jgi:hypothetical protein